MLILGLKGLINEHKQENTTVLFIFFIFCTGNGVVMS